MAERRNHATSGLLFILACVAIGVALFVLDKAESNASANAMLQNAEMAADNLEMTADNFDAAGATPGSYPTSEAYGDEAAQPKEGDDSIDLSTTDRRVEVPEVTTSEKEIVVPSLDDRQTPAADNGM